MSNERAGYLHGRAVPEPGTNPDDGASGGSATDAATSSFQNTSDSCRDFVPATQGLSARMERRNVARFRRAESMMEKGARQGGDADYLIASYQEELAKPEPDLLLAGTYLGLVSNEPMTASTIERLSQALCVPVSHEQALGIARAAEGQRRSMRH